MSENPNLKQGATEGSKNFDKNSVSDKMKNQGFERKKVSRSLRNDTVSKDIKKLYESGEVKFSTIKKLFGGMNINLTEDLFKRILDQKYTSKGNMNTIMNGIMKRWIENNKDYENTLKAKESDVTAELETKLPNRENALNLLLSKGFTNQDVFYYINKIEDKKNFDTINKLPDNEFVSFMQEQLNGVKTVKEKLSGDLGGLSLEQISNCAKATKFDEDLKNNLERIKINNPGLGLNIEDFKPRKEQVDKAFDSRKEILLKKYGSEKIARETIENELTVKNLVESDKYKNNKELFKEFDKVVVEHYEFTASIGIELSPEDKAFIEEYNTKVENESVNDTFKTKTVIESLIKNNGNVQKFLDVNNEDYNISKEKFDNYSKEILVNKLKSDPNYIQNLYEKNMPKELSKKYPKFSDYFDTDLNLKNEHKDNKELQDVQKKIQLNVGYIVEGKRDQTNTIIKNYALEKSFEILKKNMNIDIDVNKTENLIKNFTVGEKGVDVNENMELAIEGNYQGNKIKLSYDLKTGEIYYDKFLSRQDAQNSKIIDINGNQKTKIAGVELPKLGDFKDVNITEALNKDEKDYEKNLRSSLDTIANKYDTHNENFEKAMLENMLTQEMFSSMVPKEQIGEFKERKISIDPEKQNNYHKMLSLILDTATYSSTEEIKDFIDTNKKADVRKDEILAKTSKTDYKIDGGLNEEETFFEDLYSFKKQKLDRLDLQKGIDNQYNSNLLFYSSFTKEIGPQKIIGLPELKDFLNLKGKRIENQSKSNTTIAGERTNHKNGKGKTNYENNKNLLAESKDKLAAEELIQKKNLENIT